MRHVDEAKTEPPRSFSAFRIGGAGGLCGFDSHAHHAPMVGLFRERFLRMTSIDLTFLEAVSSSTLAAWLEASNRETVRLQRELDATRAAKSALLAEITRRNRVAVALPAKPKHTLAIDSTETCKNCVRLAGGWKGVFVCEKDNALRSPNAPSCGSFDPYPPQFFGAEIPEADPRR